MLKLYRVKLRGMQFSSTGIIDGTAYVVSDNPTNALEQVQDYLRDKDIGYQKDREMDSIELVAENVMYPDCGYRLFLPMDINEMK